MLDILPRCEPIACFVWHSCSSPRPYDRAGPRRRARGLGSHGVPRPRSAQRHRHPGLDGVRARWGLSARRRLSDPLRRTESRRSRVALALGVPAPLRDLGLGPTLQSAQRRIGVSSGISDRARTVHLDMPNWFRRADDTPQLPVVAESIRDHHSIDLTYRTASRSKTQGASRRSASSTKPACGTSSIERRAGTRLFALLASKPSESATTRRPTAGLRSRGILGSLVRRLRSQPAPAPRRGRAHPKPPTSCPKCSGRGWRRRSPTRRAPTSTVGSSSFSPSSTRRPRATDSPDSAAAHGVPRAELVRVRDSSSSATATLSRYRPHG